MNDDRRLAIIWLLEHRNDHLPTATRSASPVAAAGFVGGTLRYISCPDCLANDRVSFHCETCGGRGELPDPGPDPYAKNAVTPIGFDPTRHDASRDRDRKIEMLRQQTRPARSEAELLQEANRRGYAWEEERRSMYRHYDFTALDRALDHLRSTDSDAVRALNAVYIDGWLPLVGLITPLVEQHCDRGIQSLSRILPNQLRSGVTIHHAEARQHRRRTTSDTICTITSPAVAEAQPAMGTGNNAAAYPHKDAA